MSTTTTLLRPVARVAGWHAGRQLRAFLAAHRHTAAVQEALLLDLVRRHAGTAFGREHGFASIRSYDDFRRAVPVGDYETLRPYLERVYQGDTAALLPPGEPVLMFALTSGTTGSPKRIPVTREMLAHYRRGWNLFGLKALQDHPRAWLRKLLQVSGVPVEHRSPTGVPCGAISGLLAATQKRIVRFMYPVPSAVMGITDPAAKYYTIMRLAMPQDVAILSTANPSTVLQLLATAERHLEPLLRDLRDGTLTPPGELPAEIAAIVRPRLRKHPALAARVEEGFRRDGALLTRHFWDLSLLMHWTGGTLGLYLPEVRRRTCGTPVRDIGLLASEGRFSVPLEDHTPAGVAEVLGAFLEFIPAGEIDAADPPVLRCHELQPGAEYFLVLSNPAGLWRYGIHDRVRVTGFLGGSPVFAFLSKGAHTVSLTGEKLTEHQVVEAMRLASAATGLACRRFVAQAHFADPPYYRFTVEGDGGGVPAAVLAERLDAELGSLNIEYASKRHSGRLAPVAVAFGPADHFDRRERDLLLRRHGRAEQYKHQYLLTEVATAGPGTV